MNSKYIAERFPTLYEILIKGGMKFNVQKATIDGVRHERVYLTIHALLTDDWVDFGELALGIYSYLFASFQPSPTEWTANNEEQQKALDAMFETLEVAARKAKDHYMEMSE